MPLHKRCHYYIAVALKTLALHTLGGMAVLCFVAQLHLW